MKKLLLLVLALLRTVPVVAGPDETKAIDSVKVLVEAVRNHDYATIVALMPPSAVAASGGKEKVVAMFQEDHGLADLEVLSVKFTGDPQKIESTDAVVYFVRADLLSLYQKRQRVLAHNLYVAFRFKNEANWGVMDGSELDAAMLRATFRGLPDKLLLPPTFSELVNEDSLPPPQSTPPAEFTPVQAVLAAAEKDEGVTGVFRFEVKGAGRQDGWLYLNSEIDYRDQRCLTLALPPASAEALEATLGQDPAVALKGKNVRAAGTARRTTIWFFSNGIRTDKYYYQTQIQIRDISQIQVRP